MYKEFGIESIVNDLFERRIQITFSLDIDPDTATLDALIFCEKASGKIVPIDISVNRRVISLHLKEWPVAKLEYLLRIQSGSIRSIVDDELPDSIQRTIVFESDVLSTVRITSPSHHEELSELVIDWEEMPSEMNGSLVSSYYLEVGKENVFYNVVYETMITDKQSIQLKDIPDGQYYIRIRAQKDKAYGRWSDVVTFIKREREEKIEDEPIFIKELKLIKKPASGVTPSSFVFAFDEEICTDTLPKIRVTGRMI